MCEMTESMMQDVERCQEQIKTLQAKLDAVAKYLKMDFKYTPEEYEMVKPEDLAKEGMMPTVGR